MIKTNVVLYNDMSEELQSIVLELPAIPRTGEILVWDDVKYSKHGRTSFTPQCAEYDVVITMTVYSEQI